MTCTHVSSLNPRREGCCGKCGRPIPPPPRDAAFEQQFLEAVVAEAQRRANVDAGPYVEAVRARLAVGAERYGDGHFLAPGRDNLAEVCEETPDVCGYSLLELQALNQTTVPPDGVHHHLFEASVHAAIADWHARQARLAKRFAG